MCGQSFFLKLNFWKITMGTLYIKINKVEFFSYVATTKFSWKFAMFQESFYMFKALKKSMWTCDFFVWKFIFPYQMFTKSFQFFCEF
jgi:hypothetical protein